MSSEQVAEVIGNKLEIRKEEFMSYQIKLEVFEGPLDLLLHLIKKNEVNIYDIPISLITHQYLEYIDLMKEFNLEIAGDFLLMAATLTHIKSRMLLPQDEKSGADELEEDDPRAELIRKLLEYKSFKDAAEELGKREEIWRDIFYQGHEPAPASGTEVPEEDKEDLMIEVGIFELIDAFRDVLDRLPDKKTLDIVPEELTVRGRMTAIIERLGTEGINGLTLYELLENDSTKRSIVVTFLALLELAKMRVIRLLQVEDRETIRVFKSESEERDEELKVESSDVFRDSIPKQNPTLDIFREGFPKDNNKEDSLPLDGRGEGELWVF